MTKRNLRNWLGLVLGLVVPLWGQEGPTDDRPPTEPFELLGWADMTYLKREEPRADTYLNLTHVYVNGLARINAKWNAFAEVEYEYVPEEGERASEKEVRVDRIYLEYRHSAAACFRLGKVNTPAGIWKPLYWPIVVDSVGVPIMEENGYIPTKSVGLEFNGTRILKQGELRYTLIGGSVKEEIGNRQTLDDARALGGDLHFIYRETKKLGLSAYNYSKNAVSRESAVGFLPYFEVKYFEDQLTWRTEYLLLRRDDGPGADTWYTQFKYRLNRRTYANLRYDRGDDERHSLGIRHAITTATLGYLARPNWRFKFEYAHHGFAEGGTSFGEWAAWTGYVFK